MYIEPDITDQILDGEITIGEIDSNLKFCRDDSAPGSDMMITFHILSENFHQTISTLLCKIFNKAHNPRQDHVTELS